MKSVLSLAEDTAAALVMLAWLCLYSAAYFIAGPDPDAPVQSNDAQDL